MSDTTPQAAWFASNGDDGSEFKVQNVNLLLNTRCANELFTYNRLPRPRQSVVNKQFVELSPAWITARTFWRQMTYAKRCSNYVSANRFLFRIQRERKRVRQRVRPAEMRFALPNIGVIRFDYFSIQIIPRTMKRVSEPAEASDEYAPQCNPLPFAMRGSRQVENDGIVLKSWTENDTGNAIVTCEERDRQGQ